MIGNLAFLNGSYVPPLAATYLYAGNYTSSQINYSPGIAVYDYTGNPLVSDPYTTFGIGPSGGTFFGVKKTSDGKYYVYGNYNLYNGDTNKRHLVRLNSDYSIDTTYNTANNLFNGGVTDVYVEPDNKIIAVGSFTTYGGTTVNRIVRLNTDGTIATTFGTGFNNEVRCIRYWDNNYYIGGNFTTYKSLTQNRFVMIDSAGTNVTFAIGTGFNATVCDISLNGNGVCIGGAFTTFNGNTRNRLIMLSHTGVDLGWTTSGGFDNGTVFSIASSEPFSLEKYVLGSFTSYKGTPVGRIAKIVSGGSLDATFTAGSGTGLNATPGTTYARIVMEPYSTYEIFLNIGTATEYNGTPCSQIIKLDRTTGQLDLSFNTTNKTSFTSSANNGLDLIDNKVFFTGSFTDSLSPKTPYFSSFSASGNYLANYGPFNKQITTVKKSGSNYYVLGITGGTYGSTSFNNILKLTSSFAVDPSFTVQGTAFKAGASQINPQGIFPLSDGKVYVWGAFTQYNEDTTYKYFMRLNSDGTPDPTFVTGSGFDAAVRDMKMNPDESMVIVGDFTTYKGVTVNRICKLNQNGDLDVSFNAGQSGSTVNFTSLKRLSNGYFALQWNGSTGTYNGNVLASTRVFKIDPNGNYDPGFSFGNANFNLFDVDSNDNFYVVGNFSTWNGNPYKFIVKTNSSGVVDTTFNTNIGTGPNVFPSFIKCLDGYVYVANLSLLNFNGVRATRIAKISENGIVDSSYSPITTNNTILDIIQV